MRSRAERWQLLKRVAAQLEAQEDAGALERDLGLDPGELAERLGEDRFRFVEALELLEHGELAQGVGVFRAHWSDLSGGLGARLAHHVLAGRTALVLSDPRLPRAAERFALACEAAELPAGVVTLLHDDTRESSEAALGSAGLAFVRWKDHDERLDELGTRFRARVETSWELWRAANVSRHVRASDDPALAASEVADRFIARSSTLFGQLPGSTGRVLCHERVFSRFSEELLVLLERSPALARPVPFLEADLGDHVADAWSLGLDEGATPIFGAAPGEADSSPGAESSGAIVFTNVEPRSGFARRTRPAPVLGLLRVSSDEEAAELQRELDGPPKRLIRARLD